MRTPWVGPRGPRLQVPLAAVGVAVGIESHTLRVGVAHTLRQVFLKGRA